MRLGTAEDCLPATAQIRVPADVEWRMLDKRRFFFVGAALFSTVSAALHPTVVLKTRQQISPVPTSSTHVALSLLRHEGAGAFYKGLGTSLAGTIPARALYMAALEVTKSGVGEAARKLGLSETAAAAAGSAAAGVSSAVAAQLVWTPIDVVSQRLMVQSGAAGRSIVSGANSYGYSGGLDAFRKILAAEGAAGLYRGFGISILTHAPSNAVWWATYSLSHTSIWGGIRSCWSPPGEPSSTAEVGVQVASAAAASGVSAVMTTPLDTVKTRMQVAAEGRGTAARVGRTVRELVREGGLGACYRGFGARWAAMSVSAATMVTTYEFLKRISSKTS